MRNAEVVRAWVAGRRAKTRSLSTDGDMLYSYSLPIGLTEVSPDGSETKVAIAYNRGGGRFISMTTSKHVSLAIQYADRVINPVTAAVGVPEMDGGGLEVVKKR